MKIYKEDRCCTFCKFWNPMDAYCKKKDRHTHGMDNVCEQWKKAKEFVEHRPKMKKVKIERVSLL